MAREYQSAGGFYVDESGNILRQFQAAGSTTVPGGTYVDSTSTGSIGTGFLSSLDVTLPNFKSVMGLSTSNLKAYDNVLV